MAQSTRTRLVLFIWLLCSASISYSQEWTRFRGPNGTGVSEDTTIPISWTLDGLDWRIELPGVGHSSPVIWGNKVFLTSADPESGQRFALCIDAETGSTLWQREYPGDPYPIHTFNSRASSTPVVDAERVYFSWATPKELTVFALDHGGRDLWTRNLGPHITEHGFGGSPILYQDMVVLANEQAFKDGRKGVSSILALDRETGADRWVTPRQAREEAYSVPCVRELGDASPELIFNSGGEGIYGVDPWTGAVRWEIEVFDMRSVSSPIVAAGLVFGSCGSGAGGNYVVAVSPGDPASGRAAEVAYRVRSSAPYVPTPVANEDLVFLWYDKGVVTCIRAASGETVWRERVGGEYFGSPIRVGDRLYAMESKTGDVLVVSATDKFELLARNPLGEPSHSTPAVSGGRMFLRTFSHLAAVGGKQ